MRKSEIHFEVNLDDSNVPESIQWSATDNPNEGIEETKAVFVGVWDHYHKSLLALPLWTKEMEVLEMKRFLIEIMGTVANTAETATQDMDFSGKVNELCKELTKKLKEEVAAAK